MVRWLLVGSWLFCRVASIHAAEAVEGVPVESPVQVVISPELVEAHRAVALAQFRLQQARFVDLPRARRELNDQMRQTEAAIRVLQRRLRDARPFLQVGQYSPVRTAAENHQLALQAAESQRRRLQEQRLALIRQSPQRLTLYQLDLLAAESRLAAIRSAAQREAR